LVSLTGRKPPLTFPSLRRRGFAEGEGWSSGIFYRANVFFRSFFSKRKNWEHFFTDESCGNKVGDISSVMPPLNIYEKGEDYFLRLSKSMNQQSVLPAGSLAG
jgi:hypothetical protein